MPTSIPAGEMAPPWRSCVRRRVCLKNHWLAFCLAAFLISPLGAAGAWAQIDAPTAIIANTQRDRAAATQRLRLARAKTASSAMTVSEQSIASEVGIDILKQGGNAVDAAVAMGYALAVVNPCCGNIGGGGFMLVHLADGRSLFLNFRERAPLKANADMFLDAAGQVVPNRSTDSWLAVGTPGTVMGLNEALARYGTMPLASLMAPAIRLAREGFVLRQGDVDILNERVADFANEPVVAAIFLNHGRPFRVGETLVQAQLADTLSAIAKGGSDAFYRGTPAKQIALESQAHGGLLSEEDFTAYSVKWDQPVGCTYRGYQIISSPPPSSGGTSVCEILGMIEPFPLRRWGFGSVRATHLLVEAERRAFADRNSALGDPDFVQNSVAQLLSRDHIAARRRSIRLDRATPSSQIRGGINEPEGSHTTHFSVMDANGNAVSVTYTINYLFGANRIAGDTGFFLNNEMDDFTPAPGVANSFGLVMGAANAVAPGKRPLSSMAPTMLLKNGQPVMVLGSPGGPTIISTVVQCIVNMVDFGMNPQAAVDAPRFHHQWQPDQVTVEAGYLSSTSRRALENMGHRFVTATPWGASEIILADRVHGQLSGGSDYRRPAGGVAGY